MQKSVTPQDRARFRLAKDRAEILMIVTSFFVVMGMIGAAQAYDSGGVALAPGDEAESNTLLLVGVILSFFVVFGSQVITFVILKGVLDRVTESEQQLSSGVADIQRAKNDEIREMVTTRSVILNKLDSTSKKNTAKRK